ncbi:MAG: type II toxin-antitoxin system HicA family toxin [Pyrinomonadaceae bacterium]
MKVKDVIKMVEKDGWLLVRIRGSHRQFHHPSKPGTVTIAGKESIDMPVGTFNSVLKQAGLKK